MPQLKEINYQDTATAWSMKHHAAYIQMIVDLSPLVKNSVLFEISTWAQAS